MVARASIKIGSGNGKIITASDGPRLVGGVYLFDPNCVAPFDDQPREYFDQDEIKSLAASIKQDGQYMSALITRWYREEAPPPGVTHELIDGERRWLSCKAEGLFLEGKLISVKDAKDHYLISTGANFHRAKHTPAETARVVSRYRDFYEMTWQDISVRLGMNEITIRKYYDLAYLHPDILVLTGPPTKPKKRVSVNLASELSRLPPGRQYVVFNDVKGLAISLAVQKVRLAVAQASEAGEEVRRSSRGRQRRPSDDSKIIEQKLHRTKNLLDYVLGLDAEHLRKTLSTQGVVKNALLLQYCGDVARLGSEVRARLVASIPRSQLKDMGLAKDDGSKSKLGKKVNC